MFKIVTLVLVKLNATTLSATPNFLLNQNARKTTMLTLASDPAKIAEVTQFVDRVAKLFALNEDVQANLMISLTEAVNNAIIHGNGMDVSKKVTIDLRREKNRICVQVSDQGKGFDPNRLPDPTCNEHICECGGRGVFLIKQLCEKVEFANGGSTVRMQFSV